MKYEALFSSIKKHVNISPETFRAMEDRLITKTLKNGEFLVSEGQTIRYLPFINKGLMVNYRLDAEGDRHVLQIGWTGYWLGDLHSFFSGKPSKFNICAYQPTELLLIDFETFEFLTQKHPEYERYFRISMQHAYTHVIDQIFNLHSYDAEEGYLDLLANLPSLFYEIPHYLIASYLNIQPQSLSRIRKKYKNKEVIHIGE